MPSLGEYYVRAWTDFVLQLQKAALDINVSRARRMLAAGGTTETARGLAGQRAPVMMDMQSFEERVRQRAYEIWLDEGRPDGRDKEHWQRAVAEVGEEHEQEPEAKGELPPIPGPYENIR